MIDLVALSTQLAGVVSLLWTAYQEYRHSQDKQALSSVVNSSFLDNSSVKKAVSK